MVESESFNFEQLQRVSDIYTSYVGVRKVGLKLVRYGRDTKESKHLSGSYAVAQTKPVRRMLISSNVLKISRQAQLALIIHELCHYRRGKGSHARAWKNAAYLWASAFQMRHVRSDEEVKRHIIGGCSALDTYSSCDDCPRQQSPAHITGDMYHKCSGCGNWTSETECGNCHLLFLSRGNPQ